MEDAVENVTTAHSLWTQLGIEFEDELAEAAAEADKASEAQLSRLRQLYTELGVEPKDDVSKLTKTEASERITAMIDESRKRPQKQAYSGGGGGGRGGDEESTPAQRKAIVTIARKRHLDVPDVDEMTKREASEWISANGNNKSESRY